MTKVILFLCATLAMASAWASGVAALVEWDFDPSRKFDVPSPQFSLAQSGDGAFYPNLSPLSEGVGKVRNHAGLVYDAFMFGGSSPPFLLNLSPTLPTAIEQVIQAGVRIVSFSIAFLRGAHFASFERVIADNPEVIFVVSAPHIPGNFVSISALDEYPSKLGGRFPNVILAGCASSAGGKAGTQLDPFRIENQRSDAAQIFYMKDCQANSVPGPEATSEAAPRLSRIFVQSLNLLSAARQKTDSDFLIKSVRQSLKTGFGEESFSCDESPVPCGPGQIGKGVTREILYFEP